MKSITCKQMGGPCDFVLTGNTPEEIVQQGAAHVISSTDEEHKKVWEMMQQMQQDPAASKQWNEEFVQKFASLPEA